MVSFLSLFLLDPKFPERQVLACPLLCAVSLERRVTWNTVVMCKLTSHATLSCSFREVQLPIYDK